MGFFSKSLQEVRFEDVSELVEIRATENVRLEFRSALDDQADFLKKATSLANTYGGRIVYGVEADKNSVATRVPGVPAKDGLQSQLAAWAMQEVYPGLMLGVSAPIPTADPARVVYVVEVPESGLAPHFLEGRRGCFVRVGDASHRFQPGLATVQELSWLLNKRSKSERLEQRLQKSFTTRCEQFVEGFQETVRRLLIRISVGPRFPMTPVVSYPQLSDLALKACAASGRAPQPGGRHFMSSQPNAILIEDTLDPPRLFEFTTFGHARLLAALAASPPPPRSDPSDERHLVWAADLLSQVMGALKTAATFQTLLGAGGHLHIRAQVEGLSAVAVYGSVGQYDQLGAVARSRFDDFVEARREDVSDAVLRAQWPKIGLEIFRKLYFCMGWRAACDAQHDAFFERLKVDATRTFAPNEVFYKEV